MHAAQPCTHDDISNRWMMYLIFPIVFFSLCCKMYTKKLGLCQYSDFVAVLNWGWTSPC